MTKVAIEERPDGSFRVRSADGQTLHETASHSEGQAFLAGYVTGMRKALAVTDKAASEASTHLQHLQAEAAAVAYAR